MVKSLYDITLIYLTKHRNLIRFDLLPTTCADDLQNEFVFEKLGGKATLRACKAHELFKILLPRIDHNLIKKYDLEFINKIASKKLAYKMKSIPTYNSIQDAFNDSELCETVISINNVIYTFNFDYVLELKNQYVYSSIYDSAKLLEACCNLSAGNNFSTVLNEHLPQDLQEEMPWLLSEIYHIPYDLTMSTLPLDKRMRLEMSNHRRIPPLETVPAWMSHATIYSSSTWDL